MLFLRNFKDREHTTREQDRVKQAAIYGGDRNFESGSILLSNFDVMVERVFDKTPEKQLMMFQIVNSLKIPSVFKGIVSEIREINQL